jgi:hypothetical protein
MSMTKLLASVLSTEGWYCVVGLKKTGTPKQVFVETLTEVEQEAKNLLSKQYDVYFACAKYETNKTRTNDNVKNIRSFWLDIDCGEGKPYADQTDGIVALKAFCKELNLPKPTLVSSGRGVHVYWPLHTPVTRQQWKPVAERLKALCHEKGLQADPSRTADAASILRVPDTSNFKVFPPLDVAVIVESDPVDFELFRTTIGAVLEAAPEFVGGQLNELTRNLMGNKQSRFSTILLKTQSGKGCNQLAKAITEQDTLEEPLWRAALSIAAHCVDASTAIHAISDKHPGYEPAATEAKVSKIKGPYTCEVFEKINPSGCADCPHKGKLSSPITLGQELIEASPDSTEVEFVNPVSKPAAYKIPEYPFPYCRGKNGGVYRRSDDAEDSDAVLVYEYDLYVVKRLKDPQNGEVVWLRHHTPKDGVREFALAAVDLLTHEKLREKLAWHGVIALKKQMEAIMAYIVRFVKELQCREGADIMRMQFGWTSEGDSFLIGDTEICKDGDRYSPPSSYTAQLADYFTPVGSLEKWKSVINLYDKEGFEPHAFGFFSAFGAPLMKYLNLKGAIINMINNVSGTGKTTTLKTMHSVYGHPEELMLIAKDTLNTRLHRLGVMNTLSLGCDEITKMKPDDFSDFSYAVSQGRGRGRMKANENAERLNFARWQTILVCSSNASAVEKLKSLQGTVDGELMRVIEYSIPPTKLLTKQQADDAYAQLYTNYGHAGRIYIRDLVENLTERVAEVKEMQLLLDKKVGFTNRERFWSGIAACNLAGALFARRLGLIDIDVGRVFRWATKEFSGMKEDIKPPVSGYSSVIGEFWNEHRLNTLVINDEVDKRTNVEVLPIVEPKGEVVIRVEPDTQRVFISAKKLRNYCAENRITLKDVLTGLQEEGIFVGAIKKRMGKGTKLSGMPAVEAYGFDSSKGEFLDQDALIATASAAVEEDGS